MKSLQETLNENLQGRQDESLTRRGASCTVDMSRNPFAQDLQQVSCCLDDIELTKIGAAVLERWHKILKIKDSVQKANKSGNSTKLADNDNKWVVLKRGMDAEVWYLDGRQPEICSVEEFVYNTAKERVEPIVSVNGKKIAPGEYKEVRALN